MQQGGEKRVMRIKRNSPRDSCTQQVPLIVKLKVYKVTITLDTILCVFCIANSG